MVGGLLLITAALLLISYNFLDGYRAAWTSGQALAELERSVLMDEEKDRHAVIKEEPEEEIRQDKSSERMLPVIPVDGNDYIGILEIPSLELSLPIISQWSYPKLRIAPCRYLGTAEAGDLIIAAHNYDAHFGRLKELVLGDLVRFTDVQGRVHSYQVSEIEVLEKAALEEMKSGEWDLTLFTCTIGGKSRVTVRCTEEALPQQ